MRATRFLLSTLVLLGYDAGHRVHGAERPDCIAALGWFAQGGPVPPNVHLPESPVAIVPTTPRADQPVTVCVLSGVQADSLHFNRAGNHVVVSVVDSGFSWSPNPLVVYDQSLGMLPAGSYLLDVVVEAGFGGPAAVGYPQTVVSDIPFNVASVAPGGTVQAPALPALSGWAYAALAMLIALFGALAAKTPRRNR
jgi:hypothetical protein